MAKRRVIQFRVEDGVYERLERLAETIGLSSPHEAARLLVYTSLLILEKGIQLDEALIASLVSIHLSGKHRKPPKNR